MTGGCSSDGRTPLVDKTEDGDDDEGVKIQKKTSATSGAIGPTPKVGKSSALLKPQRNLHTGLAMAKIRSVTCASITPRLVHATAFDIPVGDAAWPVCAALKRVGE